FISFSSFNAEDLAPTKQQTWDTISDDVDHWIDAIGYPIDREIKEIVVALNIMGIKTTASCEGHFDHGALYPWVDLNFFSKEDQQLLIEIGQNEEQIGIEMTSLEAKYPDLSFVA